MHASYAAPVAADAGEMLMTIAAIVASAAPSVTENRNMAKSSSSF
jgi:hypothetical protein